MVPRGAYEFLDTKETRAHLIEQYDNFLFDCDGVVWSHRPAGGGVVFPQIAGAWKANLVRFEQCIKEPTYIT